jgi:hypothetical protein
MPTPSKDFWSSIKDSLLVMSNQEARQIKRLLEELIELQKQTEYPFQTLQNIDVRVWKELWKPLIKDATWLTNNDNPDLALSLLEQANLAGFTNPWTEESRAKTLAKLDRWEDALSIWTKLSKSNNKSIQEAAIKAIDDRLDERKRIDDFIVEMNQIIEQAGRKAKYLPDAAPLYLKQFQKPILAEATRFQKSNLADVSLQILEASNKAGLRSPAIEEKRARCLLDLKRNNEAVQICETLLKSKNEDAKKSAQEMLKQQSERLLTKLQKILKAEELPGRHFPKKPPAELSKLEQPILKQTNDLLNKKKPVIALRMLHTSINFGLCTDQIKGVEAKALHKKKNYGEAIQIWQALVQNDNPEVKQSAKTMLRRHSEELNSTLRTLLVADGVQIQHLPEQPPGKLAKLEQPLLKETTALIENGKAGLALRMLRTCIKHGLHTDLIRDGEANALLNRNRVNEAVAIWQSLLQSNNQTVQESAQKNLQLHSKAAAQQSTLQKVDALLEDKTNNEDAIDHATELLTDALLQDPTNGSILRKFQDIGILKHSSQNNREEQEFPEIFEQRKTLAGLEEFISSLEKRQQIPQEQSTPTNKDFTKQLPHSKDNRKNNSTSK